MDANQSKSDAKKNVSWSEAQTLEEWLISQFEKGNAKDPIIQSFAELPGYREKFREIFIQWKKRKA